MLMTRNACNNRDDCREDNREIHIRRMSARGEQQTQTGKKSFVKKDNFEDDEQMQTAGRVNAQMPGS